MVGLLALAAPVAWGNSRPLAGLPMALVLVAVLALSHALYSARAAITPFLPRLSAQGLGLFRIAWAFGLMHVFPFLRGAIHDAPFRRSEQRTDSHVLDIGPAHWLASHPGFVHGVGTVTAIALVFFALGALSRLAYLVVAAGFFVHGLSAAMAQGLHDWGLPVLVICALVLVPWGDGVSVDETVRRLRGRARPTRPTTYGLAIWLPGLLLGSAWLSAAFAKIHTSGIEWITGGAVRYHFVTDAGRAASNLGLWIASHPTAAILASAAGVLFEATFVLHVLFRSPWIRLAFGVGAALFYYGLHLFQGIDWQGWWILLIALLPWEPLAASIRSILPVQTVLIDGSCPLCRRTARVLSGLDWFDRLRFADANDDGERARLAPALDRETALERMASVRDGRPPALGLDAYISISRSIPLLVPFGLLASIWPFRRPGERLYDRIAARRVRRCEAMGCEPGPLVPAARPARGPATLGPIVCVSAVALLVQQLVVSARGVEKEPLVTNFPMYSFTYPSTAAYDAKFTRFVNVRFYRYRPPVPAAKLEVFAPPTAHLLDGQRLAFFEQADRRALIGLLPIELEGNAEFALVPGKRDESAVTPQVRRLLKRSGPLLVTADQYGFDWHHGRFTTTRPGVVLGVIHKRPPRLVQAPL
jgi:predicted DCC family thiol-disulfide oxidoreductase YuxK